MTMLSAQALMGELRSILAQEKSWSLLTSYISEYRKTFESEEGSAILIPYLLDHLSPQEGMREMPQEWFKIVDETTIISHLCLLGNSLNLEDNNLGDVREIANSPHLQNLTSLNLGYNNIGDEEAIEIANSPHLKNLIHLNLWANWIGDEGGRELANSPYLQNLTSLSLGINQLGSEGVKEIANSPYLKHLTYLNLEYNNIGEETQALLRQALPNTEISF